MRRNLLFLGTMIAALFAAIPMQAIKVYYNNPGSWTTVHAYIYKKGASDKNAEWPGVAMTKDNTTGLYSYEVPTALAADGLVIFNNNGGGNQYPESGADGLKLAGKDMISLNNNIWTEYEAAPFKVYFQTNWTAPKIYYFGAESPTSWEARPAMTKTANETNVWEYTVPAGTGAVIFTNGDNDSEGNKTADLAAKKNHKYDMSGDKGEFTPAAAPKEDFWIYFDNTQANWANPYIHYFGGEESTWPGVMMTLDSGKIWKYKVPGATTGILFNAGDGDASKTEDFDAVADHVYTQSGDQGPRATYTPTVNKPASLYILGTVGTTLWATTPGIQMTATATGFTAENVEIKVTKPSDEYGYFTFVTATGANWDVVNSSDRYGAATENAPLTAANNFSASMAKYGAGTNASAAKSWALAPGSYTITADFAEMTVTAVATGTSGPDAAQVTFVIPDCAIQQTKDALLEINLNSDIALKGIQFDITLPECVTAGTPILSDRKVDHEVFTNTVGNKTSILIYSPTNSDFTRLNGSLLYIPLTCAANATEGEHTVTINGIKISDMNHNLVKINGDQTGKIIVSKVPVGSVTLNKEQLALQIGQSETLVATVLPEDAADKTVTWTTNAPAIATVDNTGKVTGVAKGTAIITATCGDAKATCTVTVGKTPQTITWTQTFEDPIGVGETLTFDATTDAAGLAVTYVITQGNGYATIEGNVLTATAAGVVTVQAQQQGNDTYAPANPVSKTITIWLGWILGDANADGVISAADVTTTIQKAIGKNPDPFNLDAADMDGDGEITIADVTRLVELVLAQPASPAPAARAAANNQGLEQFNVSGSDYSLRISFTNMENYIATMFEITLPEGFSISRADIAGSNHVIASRQIDETTTRMLVYSIENATFANKGYVDVRINQPIEGNIVKIDNACVNMLDGDNVVENPALGYAASPTGIEEVGVDFNNGDADYFNLQGIRVYNPEKGQIYIVRRAGKVSKEILR